MRRHLPRAFEIGQDWSSIVFERIYVFSPSVNIDDGWIPSRSTSRRTWGEHGARTGLLGRVGRAGAQEVELYQVLIIIDDYADSPQLHKSHGALDTLFIRGRRMQISAWVSSQKLRLISAAVRVNMQFICTSWTQPLKSSAPCCRRTSCTGCTSRRPTASSSCTT